jgi:hypothetical protein
LKHSAYPIYNIISVASSLIGMEVYFLEHFHVHS